MRVFVIMSKICQHGPSLVEVASRKKDSDKASRLWVEQAIQLVPEARFIAHYALLGPYDFMDIYEAPDEQTAVKVAMIGSASGAFHVETWSAIPDSQLVDLARAVKKPEDRT